MSTWVVIVAAGSGSRFGRVKQFETLGNKRVLDWSIDTANSIADGVIVVLSSDALGEQSEMAADFVTEGGSTRSESVRAGLALVPQDAEVVIVHDAARPFASKDLFVSVTAAITDGADAAIPGVPVVDTIKRVAFDKVVETVDRSELVAVQTPQAFNASVLRRAHVSAPEGSDDASVVEAIGGTVVVVPGEQTNIKITVARDLATMEGWLNQ